MVSESIERPGSENPDPVSAHRWVNYSDHRCLPGYELKKTGHPEIFQGNRKHRKYFEGWYFKMVSSVDSSILCVIPGLALSRDGREKHAFIQIIDGQTTETAYYSFPAEEFSFSGKEFGIRIGPNFFSKQSIILDIQSGTSVVSGEIRHSELIELPRSVFLNPGIMGWYRFVPFMQCYHGVVSLSHHLEGSVVKNGVEWNFDRGKGYIEKDWGSSMPSAWIWMQSNHFKMGDSSFMLSVANIPWLGSSFTGFLGFFLHGHTLYRFATYTHAKLQLEETGEDTITIRIKDRYNTFVIEAIHQKDRLLMAPVKGSMDRRIPESFDSRIRLTVRDRNEEVIFDDSTILAGLEMVSYRELITDLEKKKK